MTKNDFLRLAAIVSVGMLSASEASAALLPSLNRATYQAAIAGATTLGVQNFDSLASGTTLTTLNGVTYSSSAGVPLITSAYSTSTSPNGLGHTGIGYFEAGDTATFSFAAAITAFAIDINTYAVPDGAYTATLDTGDVANSIFESFSGKTTGQFVGFVSNTPFTSVTIKANQIRQNNYTYTLDTLIYGTKEAVTGAVPEPTSWAMMIVGFGLVGATLRRRRVNVSYA